MPGRPVIIHSLADARAALAAAVELAVPITLRSAPGAAAYLGPQVFREIVEAAGAETPGVEVTAVLDCGADPGLALAAFRNGIKRVRVSLAPEVAARVADIGGQQGASLDDDPRPALDLQDCTDPVVMCRKWLSEAEKPAF